MHCIKSRRPTMTKLSGVSSCVRFCNGSHGVISDIIIENKLHRSLSSFQKLLPLVFVKRVKKNFFFTKVKHLDSRDLAEKIYFTFILLIYKLKLAIMIKKIDLVQEWANRYWFQCWESDRALKCSVGLEKCSVRCSVNARGFQLSKG